MNWNAISFDWNQARSFLAVAEEGSLSAAALALKLTQPTITRQLTALEEGLNVMLLERTGRTVSLTPAGLDLLDHVRAMAEGANMMSLAASGQSQDIEGKVRVTASEMTAVYLLPDILDRLSQTAPDLQLEIAADNSVRDLLLREADIAIRHMRPEQPNLIAKLACDQTMRFYAVDEYITRYGIPQQTGDMSEHQFVSFGDFERIVGYLKLVGLDLMQRNFRYASNSQLVEWEIARKGHAIAIMNDNIAAKFPEFRPVLTEIEPFSIPVWLVAHRELQTSRRIRLVFDILADALSGR
ncbi:LysR family transcriptional regulator [Cognatiyoonia sp. IB215446]|uniref:LysR family transcriptional regulator n=1 Tax=Cognatiyoonia sp. IB215446 TaxID=3097355 RepID=UPI002A100B71|nr:LysR family transcriptional regulator [Cognatiyoonia sp. IB215446]MDX8346935.1 LysR family transcriptional regulator [Cognatiyoonia sp. IB215446]